MKRLIPRTSRPDPATPRRAGKFLCVPVLFFILTAALLINTGTAAAQHEPTIFTPDQSTMTIDYPETITFDLNATVDQPIVRAELRFRTGPDRTIQIRREQIPESTEIDVQVIIDSQLTYLPPGIDITWWWVLFGEDGERMITEEETTLHIDTSDSWSMIENNQLRIYYSGGGESFAQEALTTTSSTITSLIDQFDLEPIEQTRMVLYDSPARFQSALPYNSPEWIGGFADPSRNLIVAGINPGPGASREIDRMLTHEAVHIVVHHATENPFTGPSNWLDEGLAVYYQNVPDARFEPLVEEAVREGRLIPVSALNSSFPNDPDLALQSYAQSESITRFILANQGTSGISNLFAAYRSGLSHSEATQVGLNMTLDELDAAWKEWLDYPGDDYEGAWADGLPSNTGVSYQIEQQWARTAPYLILGIAGIGVVIAGVILMIRKTRDQEDNDAPMPWDPTHGQWRMDSEEAPESPSESRSSGDRSTLT